MSFSVWTRSACRVPISVLRALCTPIIFLVSAAVSVFWAAATVPSALLSAASRFRPAVSLIATCARMSVSVWASSVFTTPMALVNATSPASPAAFASAIALPRVVCEALIFAVNAAVSVF